MILATWNIRHDTGILKMTHNLRNKELTKAGSPDVAMFNVRAPKKYVPLMTICKFVSYYQDKPPSFSTYLTLLGFFFLLVNWFTK